jgi:hypothetical protein
MHCIPVIPAYPQAFNYLLKTYKKTAASALTRAIRISKMRGSLNTQVQVQGNEKNISTKPDQTRKNTRFSCTQSNTGWSEGFEGASCKRPPSSGALKRQKNRAQGALAKACQVVKGLRVQPGF